MSITFLQLRAQAELERRKRKESSKKRSFREFIALANPHYKFYPYLARLIDLLQQVADNELTRLMVFMPPRHGKSELVSRLFPAYYLYRHPDQWVALTSYGAELAYSLSRNARDNYTRLGGRLKDDAAAVKHWETGQGGGLWAAGIGGPASGKGFNLGIIDDPIKDASEAFSAVIRRRNEDWFNSVFWTRREPVNAVVIIHTRWGKNDLAGYILKTENDEPEHWHIVHHEAIRDDWRLNYPGTCTIEPDDRQTGEALAPERYPLDKLKKIAKRIGKFFWDTLYQQSPIERQGRVYHQFDDKNIGPTSHGLDLSKAEGYYHAHDFGAVNRAWGLFAKIGHKYYLIHEEILPEGTSKARATKIKSHFTGRKVIAGWGGALSEIQQRRDYSEGGINIRALPVTDVESQIDKTNKMFENETLMICSDMLLTIDQLENCVRDEKEGIQDKSKWHHLDVLRYFATGIGGGGWVW